MSFSQAGASPFVSGPVPRHSLAPTTGPDGKTATLPTVVGTLWHAAGGAARGAVLDPGTLELRAAPNLFVVGAAAMPALPRANPMLACYASGWRLGEILASNRRRVSC